MSLTTRLQIPYPAGTDTDDVPNWMNQMAVKLDAIVAPFGSGPIASRPTSTSGTPGVLDRYYFATDVSPDGSSRLGVLYRDTGTSWVAVNGGPLGMAAAGTFAPEAIPGNKDYTGLGFMPKLVRFLYNQNDNSSSNATFAQGRASGSSQQFAMMMRATSTVFQRRTNTTRCIYWVDNNGTVTMEVSFVQFLADGFRLNYITCPSSPTGFTVAWEAWG